MSPGTTPDHSSASGELTANQPTVVAQAPAFAELDASDPPAQTAPLDCLLEVTVTVTAELGRVTLPIGEVLKLGVGSVVRLDRSVSEPVELIVQGVRLGRGEVVVVDNRFAIRIQEISDPRKR